MVCSVRFASSDEADAGTLYRGFSRHELKRVNPQRTRIVGGLQADVSGLVQRRQAADDAGPEQERSDGSDKLT